MPNAFSVSQSFIVVSCLLTKCKCCVERCSHFYYKNKNSLDKAPSKNTCLVVECKACL